jgi:hypothetical protein
MTTRRRQAFLPALAAALIVGVLGVQAANGGGDFVPARAHDPCVARSVPMAADNLEDLSEQVILIGLDGAACTLGVSREALVLDLAETGSASDKQIAALHAGLLGAVERLSKAGALPKASKLADEVVGSADLPWLVEQAIRLVPDSVINGIVKTGDVLRRTVNELNLSQLLANVSDPDALNNQLKSAVTEAVKQSVLARLKDLLPG